MTDERAAERHAASEQTSGEHEALMHALHLLERALASAARGREHAWRRRALAELAAVAESIEKHCASAEAPGGLVAELEQALGRSHELTAALRDHDELRKHAGALLSETEGEAAHLRERASELAQALRRHLAREADLVYETFERDVGVGD